MIKIAVVLEKCEEGGFTVSVPTLPGCFSEGETIDEAMENIVEAIELRLEPVDDDLIVPDDAIVESLVVEVSRKSARTEAAVVSESQPPNGPDRPPDAFPSLPAGRLAYPRGLSFEDVEGPEGSK
jgi:predicted RNase H-like HicB family nuclease